MTRIMVFLHGTSLMHRSAGGRTREERVRQIREMDPSTRDFADYVPVGDVVRKLRGWSLQGAELIYLTSHRKVEDIEKDKFVMRRYGFPDGPVLYRSGDETYADIVGRMMPDVYIEDDCESIGGAPEMASPHLPPDRAKRIKVIVVPECGGIDHLSDSLDELLESRPAR